MVEKETESSLSNANRKRGRLLFFLGGGLLSLGVWGLWRDHLWIAQPFYAYAWWGYIFMWDGAIAMRRGDSLFTARRRYVIPLLVWSVSFWFFFEMLNLRFQNWYYVGVFRNMFFGFAFGIVAFATVLIGMFETYEGLSAFGALKNFRGKRKPFPVWVSYAVQGAGAAMASLSILFPTYLAPLVWGSVSFLLDPWNYRHGARSVLRDFEERDWGLICRLLLAGLICGGVWESMNFFAPQKWIYTVRGLENFKLFEMPLLGFLGFPALVLDGMAVFSFLSYWFLRNEPWENPADFRSYVKPVSRAPRFSFIRTLPYQAAFWLVILWGIDRVNIASLRMDIGDLPSLGERAAGSLREKGITRPRQLLKKVKNDQEKTAISSHLGISEEELARILEEASLYSFKGIGSVYGAMLQKLGVRCVDDLEMFDIEDLHRGLSDLCESAGERAPRLDMVRVWVLAAKSRGIVLRVQSAEAASLSD